VPTRRRSAWVGLVLLAIGIAASARYPVFVDDISSPERAEVIDDIERSQAWHGHLTEGRADYYRFEAEQGDVASFEILVPKRDELRDFRPEVIVSGPGLPDGGATVPASAAPASFYEDQTQTYYWSYSAAGGQESSVTLPAQGTYEIVVRADRGAGGPYAITTGTRERWGPLDVVLFPLQWARVRLWYFK
jgi:hypothetical protein